MRFLIACAIAVLSAVSSAQTCDTSPNSVGLGAILTYAHDSDPGAVAFTVTDAPPTKFGAVIYSPIPINPMPWGSGTLCIQPFVSGSGRMDVAQVGAGGIVVMQGVPAELPGTYAQFWYRDPTTPGLFNLTNSVHCVGAPASPTTDDDAPAADTFVLGEVVSSTSL